MTQSKIDSRGKKVFLILPLVFEDKQNKNDNYIFVLE